MIAAFIATGVIAATSTVAGITLRVRVMRMRRAAGVVIARVRATGAPVGASWSARSGSARKPVQIDF